jgi:hypothetical protein
MNLMSKPSIIIRTPELDSVMHLNYEHIEGELGKTITITMSMDYLKSNHVKFGLMIKKYGIKNQV